MIKTVHKDNLEDCNSTIKAKFNAIANPYWLIVTFA